MNIEVQQVSLNMFGMNPCCQSSLIAVKQGHLIMDMISSPPFELAFNFLSYSSFQLSWKRSLPNLISVPHKMVKPYLSYFLVRYHLLSLLIVIVWGKLILFSQEDLAMLQKFSATPYLMGLVFGILFSQFRKAKKQNVPRDGLILDKAQLLFQKRMLRVACQWFGFGLMALIAFVPRSLQTGSHWSQLTMSFYWGFSKPLFLFGMILTILPTTLGFKASFFNLILTPKLFHFIARISFCSYLVHLMVIYQYIFTRNYNIYFSIIEIFVLYFGVLVVSLFFGLLLTMTVELPFAKLQRQLMRALKAKQARQSKPGELSESLTEEQKDGINKSENIINQSVHTQ